MSNKQRVIIALVSSSLYVTSYLFLVNQINILSLGKIVPFLIGVFFAIASLVLYNWFIYRKLLSAILRGLIAFLGGLIISYYLMINDLASLLYKSLFPDINFSLSGSFAGFWIVLIQILIIVLWSEKKYVKERYIRVLFSIFIGIVIMTLIEILTSSRGQSSALGILRLSIYIPVIWILLTLGVGYTPKDYSN